MILQLFLGGRRSDGGVDWLGEVEGSSTRTRGWAGAVSEHGVRGAQREPGHRDRTGPWTRTRPAAVMDTGGRLQTVHKPGALLEVNSILAAIFITIIYNLYCCYFNTYCKPSILLKLFIFLFIFL